MERVKYGKNELGGRDFVCGDLHGSHTRLLAFMEHVKFDKNKDRMFSVGDLVDRGPENEQCLALLDEPWFFAVRGNHEQLMNDWYTNGPYGPYWAQNGGYWGIQHSKEYDTPGDTGLGKRVRELAAKAAKLPLMITVERQDGKFFHVIHAELSADQELTDADLDNPELFHEITHRQTMDGDFVIWGRFIFYSLYGAELTNNPERIEKFLRTAELHRMGKMFGPNLSHIYSGHTIMKRPTRFKGQTNLDTRAFSTYEDEPERWPGLTVTEPLTDRFWTSKANGVFEVEPIILE